MKRNEFLKRITGVAASTLAVPLLKAGAEPVEAVRPPTAEEEAALKAQMQLLAEKRFAEAKLKAAERQLERWEQFANSREFAEILDQARRKGGEETDGRTP